MDEASCSTESISFGNNDCLSNETQPSDNHLDQVQNPIENTTLGYVMGEPENTELKDIAASGTASCDLKPCYKETLLTRDTTLPKEQIVHLLSEGGGENSAVIVASVPYAPLRVPSLAGDEPFDESMVMNNDCDLVPSSFRNNSCSKDIAHDGIAGMGAEVIPMEERPGYSPLTNSSASIKTVNSSLDVETDICRICHLGSEQSGINLVSPCLCSGTVEFTHHSCLTKWLAECGSTNCELCGYKFRFRNFTAFRPTKVKTISISHLDCIHLLVTLCTLLFLAGTVLYVFWVALSEHPIATRDREAISSQILLPVYATLDSMAVLLLVYEMKHTIWRLWCKWRVLNLGVVIDDRETRIRNHMTDIKIKEEGICSVQSMERNQLIQQEREENLCETLDSFNDIFEPEVVVEDVNQAHHGPLDPAGNFL